MSKDALDELLEEEITGWEDEVKSLEKQIPSNLKDEEDVEEEEIVSDQDEEIITDEDEELETEEQVSLKDLQAKLQQLEQDKNELEKKRSGNLCFP